MPYRFLALILCFFAQMGRAAPAIPPVLDIRELPSIQGKSQIRGPWEFYWQKFLDPAEALPSPDILVPAGSSWKAHEYPGDGYATYRVRLKGFTRQPKGYEIGIAFVLSASRLMLFPEDHPERVETLEKGQPGTNLTSTVPFSIEYSQHFQPAGPDEVWVVMIHVANFDHALGGLRSVPYVAEAPRVSEEQRWQKDSSLFCLGILFIMFLYNLMLYIRRREDRASLFGALAILSIALRTVATDFMLFYWIPEPSRLIFRLNHIVEYMTLTGSGILFALFMHETFPTIAPKKIIHRVALWTAPLLGLTILIPPSIFTGSLLLYQLSMGVFIVYGSWIIIQSQRRRLEGSWTVCVGLVFIMASLIFDWSVNRGYIPGTPTMQYATALYIFLGSETLARQFAKAFRTAEKLQGNLQREVKKQTAEIQLILASIPQGICTIGRELRIEGHYSQHLEHILQCDSLQGREALPLLFTDSDVDAERRSMLQSALTAAMDADEVGWQLNQHCLIHEYRQIRKNAATRILELDWHPISSSSGRVEQVLVTLRDVTDWRRLQEANKEREEELQILLELVPITSMRWHDFVKQARELLRTCQALTDARQIGMNLHSLKGLSRALGCRQLSSAVHACEEHAGREGSLQLLQRMLNRYESIWEEKLKRADHPMDQENLFEQLSAQRRKLAEDPGNSPLQAQLIGTLDRYIRSRVAIELKDLLREVCASMDPLAQELGRIPPRLEIQGSEVWIKRETAAVLRLGLCHLIRNCLDHGLETPEERLQKKKAPQGVLRWSIIIVKDWIHIACQDDGRGLDMTKLKAKARERGLAIDENSPQELLDLMFVTGLSSRDTADEVSGRGIGMDALRSLLQDIGGQVRAVPKDGSPPHGFQFFETVIDLPRHLLQVYQH